MQSAGIRGFVGKLSMDISSRPSYVEASVEHSLASVTSFVEKSRALVSHLPAHRQLVEPVITPRFVPTCSDDLLERLGKLSETKSLRIQSHLAEAHDQVEWVRRERGMEDVEVFRRVCYSHLCLDTQAEPTLIAQPFEITNYSSSLYLLGCSFPFPFVFVRYGSKPLSSLERILLRQTISSARSASTRSESGTGDRCGWWIQP
jgi:Cytosine deaminase and related metal-dependent hydrolases